MKRPALLIAGLVLTLLAGLWLGPRAVNWETWRGPLAEIASARLGRAVTLDGPIELTLLPSPVVQAGGVSIAEPDPSEGVAGFRVTARSLRLRLDLPALIGGRLAPREITLVGAELILPWPPGPILAFRPPTWITELDARIEQGRIRLGEAVLEQVDARLTSASAAQALEIGGTFQWAGRAARFTASIGRPGWDGIAPAEIWLALPEVTARARGVLVPDGGFDGTVEASGPDLSALVPSPPGAFRAAGRLNATAELVAAEDLQMDLAGAPARGAVAVRLSPAPRLDLALVASRLELDAWVAALRSGRPRAWPVSIDLAAEAANFAGQTLRRLRGGAFLEEGRLTLSDVSVLLPGETELEFAGATAGGRLEIGARFAGPDIRATLAAFGLPVAQLDPALLRRGEGRFRVVLEDAQAAVPEFAVRFETLRLSGAGTLRHGTRPALGLGLTLDRFDLGSWLPEGIELAAAARGLGAVDVNLRIAVERATLGEAVLERAAVDAAVENGRVTLRRLTGRLGETDLVVSGIATLAPQLRLADVMIEATGQSARGLVALVPGAWPDRAAIAALPVALRLSGGGTPEALAVRGTADLGELRAEAQGTLDLPGWRASGGLTLRHPGAPRLLAEAFGLDVGPWLGEGSFSLVGNVAAGPQGIAAEGFELVAAGLRIGGSLSLAAGARPRLTGRLAAERLPLPTPALRSRDPLGLAALAGFDAELAIEAARIEAGGTALDAASVTLRLADGRLRLEALRGRLAGGALEASFGLDLAEAALPALSLEFRLSEATLAGGLFGLPYDIAAGRGEVAATLTATGHAPAGLLGTLGGSWRATLGDGVVTGFDLAAAVAAAALPDLGAAELGVRQALSGGATGFERLDLGGRVEAGLLRIEMGRVTTEAGGTAALSGSADLPRAVLDLRAAVRPAAPEAPALGLSVTGPAATPRALPETADWARWRAEKG